ncbi:MAG: ATP phosphoribosyltransferase, partial [Xanthobacteraceae bacterium]
MTRPFVMAVPAKGRLQEHAEAFFAQAGLELLKPRGAREYRGSIADISNLEVAFVSAAEIVELLGQGAVDLAVTGEDLIREHLTDPDRQVIFLDKLNFGHANVVVAVPQAWIDV